VEEPAAVLGLLPDGAGDALEGGTLMQPMGCKRCGNTGYAGRVGVFELLVVTDELRRAILARKDERTLLAIARENDMRLLIEDGLVKVHQGLTTVEELLRVAGRADLKMGVTPSRAKPKRSRFAPDGEGKPSPPRDRDPGFDVGAYEKLLSRWLQPGGGEAGVASARVAKEHALDSPPGPGVED
jgi:hypothetical protein